ncbi:DUF3883 domain-containing protein [Candidatus Poseidoniales archaeon]|nr:DUF3883 domain-containing protein [Candidatus Poseidoniales archaeon]
MNSHGLSIGFLENAIPILRTIHEESNWTLEQLIREFQTDQILYRGNSERIIRLGMANQWLFANLDNQMTINNDLASIIDDEFKLLRELFWLYIQNAKPLWRKYMKKGTESCKQNLIDIDIQQIFRELKLYTDEPSEDIMSWWGRARNYIRMLEGIENTKTGDEGEFLSYRYELERTSVTPKLVAQESENLGYDIQSVRDINSLEPIFIEVKTSKNSWKKARLFFSSGEYKSMMRKKPNYYFHLWDLSSSEPKLLIVESGEVEKHIPQDTGEGEWKKVEIPFSAFNWDE